jgi:DNA (cytosine-5)-methyltransferase 1
MKKVQSPEKIEPQIDIWNKSVEVESNHYNWDGRPIVNQAKEKSENVNFIHIDLFSGCGGFSTGFEQAGFTTKVAVDIHPPSLETLRENHKHVVTILGDIRKVNTKLIKSNIDDKKIPVVITAGVPCQGFSLANRKRNADDKRNFLFKEFIRIAKEIKPAAVVLENVSGLVSTRDGEFKSAISEAISELGYDVYFALLNAADYGVPQKRRRVFFVGVPKGTKWLFPKKTHGPGTNNKYVTVGEAILGDLPKLKANEKSSKYKRKPINEFEKYIRGSSSELLNHQAPNHPEDTIKRIDETLPGFPMYPDFKQRIRLHPDDPSPTQICGGIRPQFQFGHPTQARGLTIRERARIQSFPDNYFFTGGVTQGRVQTGNAVPPLLAKVIAAQLCKVLNGDEITGEPGEYYQKDLFD